VTVTWSVPARWWRPRPGRPSWSVRPARRRRIPAATATGGPVWGTWRSPDWTRGHRRTGLGDLAEPGLDEDVPLDYEIDAEESASAHLVPIQMEGDGPLVVREKMHQAEPMTIDQALLRMELVGHDFYLFHDRECDLFSVVYRRRGYDYGVIRLTEVSV